MTRRWCHFAPRSDNAEDRELEGVPNVMELYIYLLISGKGGRIKVMDNKFVALIAGPCKPPRSVQGLGLPYLASLLEENGFKAGIFDLYPSTVVSDDPVLLDKELAKLIAQREPAIVGITIHTPAYGERVRLASFLRAFLPETLLIAGGHHPTAEPYKLLQNSDFDVCVIGEGEETVLDIARSLSKRRKGMEWLKGISGTVYKEGEKIFRTKPRLPPTDLDYLPMPAHHLLGLENYAPHPNLGVRSQGIITYRGCPMDCAFCLNPQGKKVRLRSPAKVVDEMERLVEDFGVRGFNFYDNLFGLNREHTLALCEEILRRKIEVVWDCWTAGDLVDVELAKKMKAAGCVRVGFGAESGDDEVLRKARRGFTTAQNREGIRVLLSAGLEVDVFLMLGLPGECKESVRRTVEFGKQCGVKRISLSLHRPWPGTTLWRNPAKFGVRIIKGPDYEAYIETESLSREALLESAQWAYEELKNYGVEVDFLRCDRYDWE
jgi:radical SAM superfamily enzyme YgiQ (UPF0313 family)